jgi:SAM-dependent methyltransferase
VSDSRARIVEEGFDAIADEYLAWTTRIVNDAKLEYAAELVRRLPSGSRVLELGCGAGEPCTTYLAEHLKVTGVDISEEQLRRARTNVPGAEFVAPDFTTLDFDAASFDGVAAFYCLNHVPREGLASLLARVHDWLRPAGLLVASFGAGDEEAWVGSWLGTTMFFSSWDADTNRRLLQDAGFTLLVDDLVTTREPEPDGESTFQWIVAQR